MNEITADALKPLLTDGAEIAFLDVREHGQYGEGHPFFSVNVPYSKIEFLAPKLLPSTNTRCIVMDDGDGVSLKAASVLNQLGYGDVSILTGGAPAWKNAGYTLFKGVNLPSKTFGELVEHAFDTVSISAEELNELQEKNADIVVLDGRTAKEYHKMTIPNALSCPNAELGYRLPMFVPNKDTPIIVNCAGRTRSIIGAQSLLLLGIDNPVYALRNGTQGWLLAGFELKNNELPLPLPVPDQEMLDDGKKHANKLRDDYSLDTISGPDAQEWLSDNQKTTYLFDVRSAQEFNKEHVQNARSAPGGQLVQATDEQLAVRNARIILCCDNGLRSAITAIWLKGMGHNVWLLDTKTVMSETISSTTNDPETIDTITTEEFKNKADQGAQILDASKSLDYRDGHIEGAIWQTRARIDVNKIKDPANILLTGKCPILISGLANEIHTLTGTKPTNILLGSNDIWKNAGFEIVETPYSPSQEACIDHLFFVHDRHDGNLDAARRYLEWEVGLLAQLDDQERNALKPLRAKISG